MVANLSWTEVTRSFQDVAGESSSGMHVTRGQLGTTGAPEIPGSSVQPRIHRRSFIFLFFFKLTAPYQNGKLSSPNQWTYPRLTVL